MSLETLTIELTGDGYQYVMKPLSGVDESQEKPAFSISPPGQSAANNILLGIQGQQGDIRIQFFLHDDGTDRANGTAPTGEFADDTVVTIAEQREWLRDFVHAPAFDSQHTLTHDTGNEYSSMDVYLETIDIPTLQQDSPKWTQASMRLRRGGPV
jgi:hypothetical protein